MKSFILEDPQNADKILDLSAGFNQGINDCTNVGIFYRDQLNMISKDEINENVPYVILNDEVRETMEIHKSEIGAIIELTDTASAELKELRGRLVDLKSDYQHEYDRLRAILARKMGANR
jgi:hypothetical protein